MCVWDFLTFCLAGLIFFNTSQVSTECQRVNVHLLPPIHCLFVCGFMIVNEQHVEQEILNSSWDFASGQYFSGWSLHRLLLNVWMDYSEIVFMVPRGWILLTSVCSATRKLTFFSFKGNILTSIGWTEIWYRYLFGVQMLNPTNFGDSLKILQHVLDNFAHYS